MENESAGRYCYYVSIVSTQKHNSYTLPGLIAVEADTYEDGNGVTQGYRDFHIEKVYFDNGDYLDFTNIYEQASIAVPVTLSDQNEKDWRCTILNIHAYNPCIKETSHITVWEIIELVLLVFATLYNRLGCMALSFADNKHKEKTIQ